MKRFLSGLIIGVLVSIGASGFAQTDEINLIINGQKVNSDVKPVMINNRVMVPARFVAEPLGANVRWDQVTQSVVVDTVPIDYVSYKDILSKYGLQSGHDDQGYFYQKGNLKIREIYQDQSVTLVVYVDDNEIKRFVGAEIESRTYFSNEIVNLIQQH